MRLFLIPGLVLTYLLSFSAWAQTPQPDCDPLIKPASQNPQAYREREITCEGIYIQEVSATSIISLAAFTETIDKETRDRLESLDSLYLSWLAPDTSQLIKIRGQGLKRKLYYRMDSKSDALTGGFEWKTGTLKTLDINLTDIGLISWIPNYLEGEKEIEALFVPLKLTAETSDKPSYSLSFMPLRSLKELSYSVSTEDGQELQEMTPLNYGYYPNERPIVIRLEALQGQPPGIYRLELIAEPENGSARPLEIWFYHAGTF